MFDQDVTVLEIIYCRKQTIGFIYKAQIIAELS